MTYLVNFDTHYETLYSKKLFWDIMSSNKILNNCRLYCYTKYPEKQLFFSLVDYRNSYFSNNDPDKIIEFYNGFDNREQLINWMCERPKGYSNIHEIEGDTDIVIVIPTADFNGKFAIDCRESIFKGLHIIFVESGGREDFYFNYAYNCNVGIRKAMEYNPKWVVLSSDDMVKIDDVNVLHEELLRLDPKKYDVVFTKPSRYHSSPEKISEPNILYYIYMIFKHDYGRYIIKIHKKFGVRYLMSPVSGMLSRPFKKGHQYLEIQDFGIYSSVWISGLDSLVYDETFINAAEDTDLSLRISLGNLRIKIIDYTIGDLIGATLGTGIQRRLRTISSRIYLNWKWNKEIEQKEMNRFNFGDMIE